MAFSLNSYVGQHNLLNILMAMQLGNNSNVGDNVNENVVIGNNCINEDGNINFNKLVRKSSQLHTNTKQDTRQTQRLRAESFELRQIHTKCGSFFYCFVRRLSINHQE